MERKSRSLGRLWREKNPDKFHVYRYCLYDHKKTVVVHIVLRLLNRIHQLLPLSEPVSLLVARGGNRRRRRPTRGTTSSSGHHASRAHGGRLARGGGASPRVPAAHRATAGANRTVRRRGRGIPAMTPSVYGGRRPTDPAGRVWSIACAQHFPGQWGGRPRAPVAYSFRIVRILLLLAFRSLLLLLLPLLFVTWRPTFHHFFCPCRR